MDLHDAMVLILLTLCSILPIFSADHERSTYIIHMDKSSMPKAFSNHHHWYSSTLKSAKSATQKTNPHLVYTYDNAFHGFTAVLSKTELESLKKSKGFLTAYPDGVVIPHTTRSTEFLSLSSAHGIWPASQYGKDVIIGIIDSGIWPESPSFNDDGMTKIPSKWKGICQAGDNFNSSMCNKKLIGAQYFNAGVRAADPTVTFADNSARDYSGHGTHVASIAAGNYVDRVSFFGYASGTARGVAPRARLAVYKVIWPEGSTQQSDLLAAFDKAVADGVDILSVSLGYDSFAVYEDPLAIASFGAREKGVFVANSAGNRGSSIATLFGGIPWAVTVASGTIDRWFSGALALGNGKKIVGWSTFPLRNIVRNVPLVWNETLSACSSTELLSEAPSGSVIICNQTGEVETFYSISRYLSESDVVQAAIIISEDTGILRSAQFRYPGVVITPKEAIDVIKYASESTSPTATIEFQQTVLGLEPRPAPALSESSSRGPARNYQAIMKPDIMAPGVMILAAYYPYALETPLGRNKFVSTDYMLLSGTSMACPHIAGVAALLKAAHPEWGPAAIQSAMMTTASQVDNTNRSIREMWNDSRVATPLGIGAGQVDPNRALDPGLIYDSTTQDLVNLVCSMNFTTEQTRTITKSSYNCSNPSSDLNYPSFIALYDFEQRGVRLTRKFKRTLTNLGAGAATYRVKLEKPRDCNVTISPKILVFRKKYEKRSYSLSITYRSDENFSARPGSVTWIEENGNHTVRSPLVVSAGVDNF